MEIVCDESGYEGDKLVGATTDVFAHASVRMSGDAAAAAMAELRRRIQSPAQEYKANHILRGKQRRVLEWLVGPSGLLDSTAHLYLVDKAFFVVGKVVELLIQDTAGIGLRLDPSAQAMAVTLHREGRDVFGPARWAAFLVACNDLMRTKNRPDAADAFFHLLDAVQAAGPIGAILDGLRAGRSRAAAYRARLPEDLPAMDPLMPAIIVAVTHWSRGGAPVAVVHDQQTTLSAERVTHLARVAGGRLGRLTFADSRTDPRIQFADVIGGLGRKIAENALGGHGDASLTGALRPLVDPDSIWCDEASWVAIGPPVHRRS
jgi:hypothetical protein